MFEQYNFKVTRLSSEFCQTHLVWIRIKLSNVHALYFLMISVEFILYKHNTPTLYAVHTTCPPVQIVLTDGIPVLIYHVVLF